VSGGLEQELSGTFLLHVHGPGLERPSSGSCRRNQIYHFISLGFWDTRLPGLSFYVIGLTFAMLFAGSCFMFGVSHTIFSVWIVSSAFIEPSSDL
jgi:hypothetical protein